MASVKFTVINPLAPREAVDPAIDEVANHMRDEVASRTPVDTGTLQAGWQVQAGRVPGVRLVYNDVSYARYVEYGTSRMAAEPMLGPVVAEMRTSLR